MGSTTDTLRGAVYEHAGGAIDLWLGESADSNQAGTPGVTNSYASGFLWLDKLGIVARNRFQMIFRQDFYGGSYSLLTPSLYPTPDFWLSYIYKRLVGRNVYDVTVSPVGGASGANSSALLRLYAHNVSPRSGYSSSSLVVYGVNINTDKTAEVRLSAATLEHVTDVHIYLLTPEHNNLTSTDVQLNGKTLRLVDDVTLPTLNPVRSAPTDTLTMPPLTLGFFVLVKP